MFFKKNYKKSGDLFFTFPDGEKLYRIKDSEAIRLPNKLLQAIQENSNYISYLGLTKANLNVSVKKMKEKMPEYKHTHNEDTYQDIMKILDFIDVSGREYDRASQAILVNLFDLYFYFENENPFEKTDETLEKKKYYLDNYVYFQNFFFQNLKQHFKDYMITLEDSISYAILQTSLTQFIKDLIPPPTKDSKI